VSKAATIECGGDDGVVLNEVSKRFGTFLALDRVTIAIRPGTIHALVGENGAGKTTLMNILYGLERPTVGGVQIGGRVRILRSPRDAHALGIGMVQQHFALVGSLTVVENVVLGMEGLAWGLGLAAHARRLQKVAERHSLRVDPHARVRDISAGECQKVQVLKLLYWNASTLLLDEPTSSLTLLETEELFEILRRLRAAAKTIVFITHKLAEVMAVADQITVLRKGRVVADVPASGTDAGGLARSMTGRDLPATTRPTATTPGKPVFEATDLVVRSRTGVIGVNRVSFTIRNGEVFGIAGVSGNGQAELGEAVAGLIPVESGSVAVDGHEVTASSVAVRKKRRLGYTPADRQQVGLLMNADLATNAILRNYYALPFAAMGVLHPARAAEFAARLLRTYRVAARGPSQSVRYLSGGNQQRLVLGRELEDAPIVLVADNPCQGLDISAVEFVHEELRARAAAGFATLYISTEHDHLLAVCDRIGVMYRGELRAVFSVSEATQARLGRLMAGLPDDPTEETQ
jgi:ABC-type uncharacterized transport system ATPase subunit